MCACASVCHSGLTPTCPHLGQIDSDPTWLSIGSGCISWAGISITVTLTPPLFWITQENKKVSYLICTSPYTLLPLFANTSFLFWGSQESFFFLFFFWVTKREVQRPNLILVAKWEEKKTTYNAHGGKKWFTVMMKVLCCFISTIKRQARAHILVTLSVLPGTNKVTQAKYQN